MRKIAEWFTDGRRQAIQGALAAVMPLLVFSGALVDDQVQAILLFTAAGLQLAQGVVGLVLLRASDAARWFNTAGRGLIYALAGAVGPLGVAFRWWGDDVSGSILTVTGLALTALAAATQIVNVQTVDGGASLPDPATATRAEYQSALERDDDDGGR